MANRHSKKKLVLLNPYVQLERYLPTKIECGDNLLCFICGDTHLGSKEQPRRRYEEQATLFKKLLITSQYRTKLSPPMFNHFKNNVESCSACLKMIKEVYALHQEITTLQQEMNDLLEKGRTGVLQSWSKSKKSKESSFSRSKNQTQLEESTRLDEEQIEIKEEVSHNSDNEDMEFEELIFPDLLETSESRPIRQSKLNASKHWQQSLPDDEESDDDNDPLGGQDDYNPSSPNNEGTTTTFNCSKCGKILRKKSSWIRHEMAVCKVEYDQAKLIKYEITLHPCAHCERKFVQKSELKRHSKVHRTDRPWCCSKCGRAIKKNTKCRPCIYELMQSSKSAEPVSDDYNHSTPQVVHVPPPPSKNEYPCSKCGKVLKTFVRKICHEVTVCKVPYSDEELAQLHVKFHQCDLCPRKFISQRDLTTHNLRHSGLRSLICDKCGTSFRHRSALITHQKVYCAQGDVNPEVRNKFKQRKANSNLKNSIQCPQCLHRFMDRNKFIRHISSSAHDIRFRRGGDNDHVVCSVCDQSMGAGSETIKEHIRTIHNKELTFV